MSTWSVDAFGNDEACDWTYELNEANDLRLVEATLDAVLAAGSAPLGIAQAAPALAAIEVIARLQGNWGVRSSHSENVDGWVERKHKWLRPTDAQARKAHQVVERILGPASELKEFWQDSRHYSAWVAAVQGLKNRVNVKPGPAPAPVPGDELTLLGEASTVQWPRPSMSLPSVFVPMTPDYYRIYVTTSVAAYAQDNVACGRWPAEGALQRSQEEHDHLLPQGLATPDNYLFEIKDRRSQATVGCLWFTVADRHGWRTAFIYDLRIHPEHRRKGHASRALDALEPVVHSLGATRVGMHLFAHNEGAQALYARLGYRAVGVSLLKTLRE